MSDRVGPPKKSPSQDAGGAGIADASRNGSDIADASRNGSGIADASSNAGAGASKNGAPRGFDFSTVLATGAFHRLIRVTRAGKTFACRRLSNRGLLEDVARARMETEAAALRVLAGTGAPHLEVSGHDEEGPFNVMAWVPGETLATYTQLEVPPQRAVRLAGAAFRALSAVHENGRDGRGSLLVHGDVRPENLILSEGDALATFIDFALARFVGQRLDPTSASGAFAGSLHYAAPEAARGEPSGQPADVFSLAMCILHLIEGAPPRVARVPAELLTIAAEQAPRLPLAGPHAPLVDAIRACFSVVPSVRPRASDVAAGLASVC